MAEPKEQLICSETLSSLSLTKRGIAENRSLQLSGYFLSKNQSTEALSCRQYQVLITNERPLFIGFSDYQSRERFLGKRKILEFKKLAIAISKLFMAQHKHLKQSLDLRSHCFLQPEAVCFETVCHLQALW